MSIELERRSGKRAARVAGRLGSVCAIIPPGIINRRGRQMASPSITIECGAGNGSRATGCGQCEGAAALDFDFTMAFQPIVNVTTREVFAHEALVRGTGDESASHVLGQVGDANRYRFDQACRVEAIRLAALLGMRSSLSINFMPNAVYRPENCIRSTIEAAAMFGFPVERIIFEITEGEKVDDPARVREIVDCYKGIGFRTAIDDFGAGYAGLSFLAEFRTDLVKLDMKLIRGIDKDMGRRAIVRGVVQVCRELSIEPIGEGVETYEELGVLKDFGIELFQGYYFARPAFQALAVVPPEAFERR
jgi:EAL domain-containing protein (putative c-di-GMP-specific phosphodiesterase class I)